MPYLKFALVPIIFAVILPSKTTIQLIAIGKASEVALNTKLGSKGLEAIDAIFDSIIKEKKAK